ncbi:uncharacterized protein LOC142698228 [Rhinoderma darwinii]|uniref:uncharacterized protein LOC142698228 n=1 Tax=Rhinoderma darwinii TaxID=43563 RepID=UPI003F6780E9
MEDVMYQKLNQIREIMEKTKEIATGKKSSQLKSGHNVAIVSALEEKDVQWLLRVLSSAHFHEQVINLNFINIMKTKEKNWEKMIAEYTFCIYVCNEYEWNQGASLTQRVKSLSAQGKENLVVVIDDAKVGSNEEKSRLLEQYPNINKYARGLFLFSSTEKESDYQKFLHSSLQPGPGNIARVSRTRSSRILPRQNQYKGGKGEGGKGEGGKGEGGKGEGGKGEGGKGKGGKGKGGKGGKGEGGKGEGGKGEGGKGEGGKGKGGKGKGGKGEGGKGEGGKGKGGKGKGGKGEGGKGKGGKGKGGKGGKGEGGKGEGGKGEGGKGKGGKGKGGEGKGGEGKGGKGEGGKGEGGKGKGGKGKGGKGEGGKGKGGKGKGGKGKGGKGKGGEGEGGKGEGGKGKGGKGKGGKGKGGKGEGGKGEGGKGEGGKGKGGKGKGGKGEGGKGKGGKGKGGKGKGGKGKGGKGIQGSGCGHYPSLPSPGSQSSISRKVVIGIRHKVGIFSRSGDRDYSWLMSFLTSETFRDHVLSIRPCLIFNNGYEQMNEDLSHCTFAILYHSKNRGRVNITDVTDSLYDEELQHLSMTLEKKNIMVIIDDVEDTSDQEKRQILFSQPKIADYANDLILISYEDKTGNRGQTAKSKILQRFLRLSDARLEYPPAKSGYENQRGAVTYPSLERSRYPPYLAPTELPPSSMGRVAPTPSRSAIGIFSRSDEYDYFWLRKLLTSEDSGHKDVLCYKISANDIETFREVAFKSKFGILYHSVKRGKIRLTDVKDSLYHQELEQLSIKLGKRKMIVVIDDLDNSRDTIKQKILEKQPSLGRLAADIFLFTVAEKKDVNDQSQSKHGSKMSKTTRDKISSIKKMLT